MSLQDIIDEVRKYNTKYVCLTGGEPSLQVDRNLIRFLHFNDKEIHIETNGTNNLPKGIDFITLSPKNAPIKLKSCDELKIVYQNQKDINNWLDFHSVYRYLQPCSCKNTKEVINYIKNNPKWRISLQTQKILNIQ